MVKAKIAIGLHAFLIQRNMQARDVQHGIKLERSRLYFYTILRARHEASCLHVTWHAIVVLLHLEVTLRIWQGRRARLIHVHARMAAWLAWLLVSRADQPDPNRV